MRALVTGGAGFIGSRLVQALSARGDEVSVLDNLDPTAHAARPFAPSRGVRFVQGSVSDTGALDQALRTAPEVVFHEAALVGFGNGNADRQRFHDTNVVGTQVLLGRLARMARPPRLVLASSMAVYGEGVYRCVACNVPRGGERAPDQLERGEWEPRCGVCGEALRPAPVPETHPHSPRNAYASSKSQQESTSLRLAKDGGIVATALRYHNVFGPRMPRNTPYAGVASLFKSRILAGEPPRVHEDGGQLRDFVHVDDIVAANLLAADAPAHIVDGQAYNVGGGQPMAIRALAEALVRRLAPGLPIELTGSYRPGDARHVFGSIEKIRRELGYSPIASGAAAVEAFASEEMRDPVHEVPAT